MFRWRRADELRRLITATRRTGNESSQRESSRTGERKKCQLPHTTQRQVGGQTLFIRQFHDFRINLINLGQTCGRCTYLSPENRLSVMAREAVECRRTHTGNKILSTLNNFSFACSRNSTPNRPTTQPMRFSRQQNTLFGHFTRFHTVRCRCYLGDDDIAREFHDKMHLN